MRKNDYQKEIQIECGKVSDDFDTLKDICKNEADKLVSTIQLSDENDKAKASFWTSDCFPELIGVAVFTKGSDGSITYELDFSESTL